MKYENYYWYDSLVDGDPGAFLDDFGPDWKEKADLVLPCTNSHDGEYQLYGFLLSRFSGRKSNFNNIRKEDIVSAE